MHTNGVETHSVLMIKESWEEKNSRSWQEWHDTRLQIECSPQYLISLLHTNKYWVNQRQKINCLLNEPVALHEPLSSMNPIVWEVKSSTSLIEWEKKCLFVYIFHLFLRNEMLMNKKVDETDWPLLSTTSEKGYKQSVHLTNSRYRTQFCDRHETSSSTRGWGL